MGSVHVGNRRRGTRASVRHRFAYTLVELLIVIGVLGMAGAIVVPSLQNEDDTDVQAAVRKMIGDLSFAQSDALARQEYRRVHFFDDGRGYCIVRETGATYADAFDPDVADYVNDPLGSPGSMGRYIVDFTLDNRFRNVRVESASIDGGGRDIVYDPIGGTIQAGDAPGSGGAVVLVAVDSRFEISISAFTGKLSVRRIED